MKHVQALKNQYRGVNAHLHSWLQAEGGWVDFHAQHIADLARQLKMQLHGKGYTVRIQDSLQIKRLSLDTLIIEDLSPESDVLVYGKVPTSIGGHSDEGMGAAEESAIIAQLLYTKPVSDKKYRAVVIHQVSAGREDSGVPVAWIEVLSPSNKGNSKDARLYANKRLDLIAAGLVFVELDYLHESPATMESIQRYYRPSKKSAHPTAYPYHVIVLDAREKQELGPGWVYSVAVDEPLPTIAIPLLGADAIQVDFDAVYQKTFEEGLLGDEVNYAQLPVHFERYNHRDQTRIARRMLSVLEIHRQRGDLSAAPFSTSALDLDTALQRIAELTKSGDD